LPNYLSRVAAGCKFLLNLCLLQISQPGFELGFHNLFKVKNYILLANFVQIPKQFGFLNLVPKLLHVERFSFLHCLASSDVYKRVIETKLKIKNIKGIWPAKSN